MKYLLSLIEEYRSELDKFNKYRGFTHKFPFDYHFNYAGDYPSKERLERLGKELRKESVEIEKVLKHGEV